MVVKLNIVRTLFENTPIGPVSFSPRGRYILGKSRSELRLWDVLNNTETSSVPTEDGLACAFSPDGETIAVAEKSGSHHGVGFYSVPSLNRIDVFSSFDWQYVYAGEIWDITFTLSGDRLIIGRSDAFVSVLSLPSLKETATISLFSDEDYKRMYPWDRRDITRIKVMVLDLDVSPDGRSFLSVCTEKAVQFFDLETYQLSGQIDLPIDSSLATDHFSRCSFSPAGNSVVTSSGYQPIMCWDIRRLSSPKWRIQGNPQPYADGKIAFTADGAFVICGGRMGIITIVETATGKVLNQVQVRPRSGDNYPEAAEIWDLNISQSNMIVTSHRDDVVRLWSLQL